jgi:hypothetical protein
MEELFDYFQITSRQKEIWPGCTCTQNRQSETNEHHFGNGPRAFFVGLPFQDSQTFDAHRTNRESFLLGSQPVQIEQTMKTMTRPQAMPISERVNVSVATKHKNDTAARNDTALNIYNHYETLNVPQK